MANFSINDPRILPASYPSGLGAGGVSANGPSLSSPFPIGQCTVSAPDFSSQSVASLMSAPGFAPSNPYNAANLLNTQAGAAASITNPSSEDDAAPVSGRQALKGTSIANKIVTELTSKGTRAGSRVGRASRTLGPILGVAGSALAVPTAVASARDSIGKAIKTGDRSDVAQAVGNTTDAISKGATAIDNGLGAYKLGARTIAGRNAGKAAEEALRKSAPNASKSVVQAVRKKASQAAVGQVEQAALKELAAEKAAKSAAKAAGKSGASSATKAAAEVVANKAARRGVVAAATDAAKATGSLAKGAGVTAGRSVAKEVLKEGGEAAAKAATKAAAKGGLKAAGKAVARFAPGLNIAIAAADTATMAATLADPKSSTGKKVTSVITAAGSWVAATDIPVVSQVGAVVSAVSDFVGSFF